MDHVKYVVLNGKPLRKEDPVFFHYNRGFRFGDAVFETIHANGTELQFFDLHFKRLQYAMKIFKMDISDNIIQSILYSEAKSLLVRNKLFQGAKVRLTVFRNGAGTYKPETNNVSYFIETEYLNTDKYNLNTKGLIIDIFNEVRKPVNSLSSFKNANSVLYTLASINNSSKKTGDSLIINESGNIIESTSSNIFIVKNKNLYTPSIDEGCINGIMRNIIINLAIDAGFTVFEDCYITIKDMEEADEVFLTNSVIGIKWVLAFKERRYFNKTAKTLIDKLNALAFS